MAEKARPFVNRLTFLVAILLAASSSGLRAQEPEQGQPPPTQRLKLEPYAAQGAGSDWKYGRWSVPENRKTKKGRRIDLFVLVLPARGPAPRPDPVFYLDGGPGGAATRHAGRLANSWMRRDRDIVLVDQRGTGRSNPLPVVLPGSDDDLQGYLEPMFRVEVFRRALRGLLARADLRQYTTPIAMDDLDEVRDALGYERINLAGGSYGTRAALIYMRRHEESVRSAILTGVAPVSFLNPLFHAQSAREGLDRIFEECENDPKSRRDFPGLRTKFAEILTRLDRKPRSVAIRHPRDRRSTKVRLSRDAFCEGLRVMMYTTATNRQVPRLLLAAHAGDFAPFAEAAIRGNRGIRGILSLGMLMSVVGSEDIPRITEEAIIRETTGTFLGDSRVRQQMAVARIWPRGEISSDYGRPVAVSTPTLLLSGTHDPVTPPRWGAEAARHLENSLHLVVPGTHGGLGPVVERLKRSFLRRASVEGLDLSGLEDVSLPPFGNPGTRRQR